LIDFKGHHLFPTNRDALRSAVVNAYSKVDIASIPTEKTRLYVSKGISTKLEEIGNGVIRFLSKCVFYVNNPPNMSKIRKQSM